MSVGEAYDHGVSRRHSERIGQVMLGVGGKASSSSPSGLGAGTQDNDIKALQKTFE